MSERLVDDSGVDKVSYAERCESINGIYLILYKLCDIIGDKIRTGMVFNKYCWNEMTYFVWETDNIFDVIKNEKKF